MDPFTQRFENGLNPFTTSFGKHLEKEKQLGV
jgi:hypothetical protein